MPKSKHPPKQTTRFWRFLKKRPKTFIALTVILVLGVSFGISQEIEQQRQAHKLRIADEKIQQFADQVEEIDPDIKFEREKYCRHNQQKLGKGALICISSARFSHKYANEQDLQIAIKKLKSIVESQSIIPELTVNPKREEVFRSTISSGGGGYDLSDGAEVGFSYRFFHFEGPWAKEDGQLYFNIETNEKVHRSIYRYVD